MSGKRQKKVSAEGPPPVRPDQVRNATGTDDAFLQKHLINQVLQTLWLPDNIGQEEITNRFVATIAQMECIRPQDGVESMLTAQMVGIHNAALECIRRAMLPQQSSQGRDQNLKYASNLSAIYLQQMAALDKHRGKGQQKVTVEHVHVEAGGQAIVGHVERGRAAGRRTNRAGAKPERLSASTSDAPQPFHRMNADPHKRRTDDGED